MTDFSDLNPQDLHASGRRAGIDKAASIRGKVPPSYIDLIRAMYANGVKEARDLIESDNKIHKNAGHFWLGFYEAAAAHLEEVQQ